MNDPIKRFEVNFFIFKLFSVNAQIKNSFKIKTPYL